MVLVHVTAFKGHHKIQDQWENREYIVEKHPYPDVPVYVLCPRDGEGCRWTLYRNYLLPISSNIGQDEKGAPMAGVESTNTSTPAPPVDGEPADAGPSGMVMSSAAGNTALGSLDPPAPLRCDTKNPEPTRVEVPEFWFAGRYQSIQHLGCIGWSVYLSPCHILPVHHFLGKYSVNTLYLFQHMSAKHHSFQHWGEFFIVVSVVDFWMGGGPKIIWPKHNCPTRKNLKRVTPIETLGVCSSPTQKTRWQT